MTQRRFLTRGKAVIAAVLVSATMLGSAPAMAGPLAGVAATKLTVEVCAPLTATTGFPGLACFVAGAALSIGSLLSPSP